MCLSASEGAKMPPSRKPAAISGPELAASLEDALFQIKRVVVGQERLVERAMLALLTGGQYMIEGVPGLAKTLTVWLFARVVGGEFTRIELAPDLVPADIVGTIVWRPSNELF